MTKVPAASARRYPGVVWRVGCTVLQILILESLVCGVALLPVVVVWLEILARITPDRAVRAVVVSLLLVPSYVAFACGLTLVSPVMTRLTGARTPLNAEMRIAEMGWPLMAWARYMVATHVVRLFAGALFRGSPIWTCYLRLNGARIGRRVFVNSLFVSDHNLLEFGDDVVIGGAVHLSGHTVEAGVVKTARVRLGSGVTIGLGSVVDIGVTAGDGCQVGAMSLVPKYTTLEPGIVYAGIPVRRLERELSDASGARLRGTS